MAFLQINPRYRERLARLGLETPADFLALPGVVYCGHPDRHVARVELGDIPAFLKREHRVRWKDRLANAWAGFGLVSKAQRECQSLREAAAAGIGCPEPIAAGADRRGRAFLLLRAVAGRELRSFLKRAPADLRRLTAVRLGEELARIHAAGFDHPDLYSKHILVGAGPGECPGFHILDWQRSRRRRRVGWAVRARDLAALDATVADDLASPRDRLAFLRAYLRSAGGAGLPALAEAARAVRAGARRLLSRRRIRELRQPPLEWGQQNLVWLRGEALCVTREFRAELRGLLPDWLALPGDAAAEPLAHTPVERTGGRKGLLIRRRESRPLAWLRGWLRGRRLVSRELEQAGLLFRLQRYGIVTPRLLAVGQHHRRPWRMDSLLLIEPVRHSVPLAIWLGQQAEGEPRWLVLRRAAEVLRRVHDAGCSWGSRESPAHALHVRMGDELEVVLGGVEGLDRRCSRRRARRDLVALWAGLAAACRRTEFLWFLLGYLDLPRLTPAARRLARTLLRRVRSSTAGTPAATVSPALLLPGFQPPLPEAGGAAARRPGR